MVENYASPYPPLNKKIKKVTFLGDLGEKGDFLSHNSDFFLRIAWYKLAIVS